MRNNLSSIRAENNNKPISKIYLAGFCLILTLPLLSIPPIFDPPDWGKTIIFRIVISLLALFFGYQVLFKKIAVDFHFNWRKSTDRPIILLIALFLCYGLSTAFSVDIHNSLWGTPYRAGGMVNLIFLFIYTALVYLLISRTDFLKLLKVAVFTGLIVAIIGLCQRFGIFATVFQETVINITSTLGGPNFLSLYLLILLFVAIYLFIRETTTYSRIIYSVIIAVFIATIFLCISQATYLGLVAGAIYLVLFFPKKNRWLPIIKIGLILAIVLIVGVTVYLKTHLINNPLSEVALFSWHIDESRLSAWKVSMEAIKNRPLFGYGPENFAIAFNRYYDPKLPKIQMDPYYKSSWWDRPHNIFVEIAINNGVLGLIAYLSFFGLLIWKLIVIKPTSDSASNTNTDSGIVLISHFLVAIFVAYFTNLLFAFDTFSSSLLIFTLIAFSFRLINSDNTVYPSPVKPVNISGRRKAVYAFFVIIAGLFINNSSLKPLVVNSQINSAQEMAVRKDCLKAIDLVNTSRQQNTIINGYLRLKSAEILKCGLTSNNDESAYDNQSDYANRINQIIAVLKESADISPQNPKAWLYLSEFTTLLIDKETDLVIKNNLLDIVNNYLKKAAGLSPKRQEIMIDWAKANIAAGNYHEALKKAIECHGLNANLGECYWLMGISQIYLGTENTQIANNLQLAKSNGYNIELTPPLTVLTNAYIATNNFSALVEPFQKLIILNPTIGDYHGQLAVVYKELGDYQKAKDEALKLLEIDPGTKDEVEAFIESLPPTTTSD